MKKIGIITFHRAHNFGAMLQAFALQTKLSEQYQVEIIDYRSTYEERKYLGNRSIKEAIKNCLRWLIKPKMMHCKYTKKRHFGDFINNYLVVSSESYDESSIEEASDRYDLIISGSDQVWNPVITHGDLNYFLKFAPEKKRYSYAASFGGNQVLESPLREDISQLLCTFQSLLLREKNGLDILMKLQIETRLNPAVVCDPVFLLTRDEWISNLQLKKSEDRYILLFIVSETKYAVSCAKKLSEKTGLPVRYINSYSSYKDVPKWCESYMNVGPKQFLELLMNAEYVIASSFHGMALSIVFNKQFFYELNHSSDNTNDRLISLAERFELGDREIKSDSDIVKKEIDYDAVNSKMKSYREYSERALANTLYE